jgi:small-conductance mechanosensitive channel
MNLLHSFEAIHASVTRRWWMQLFAAFVRCLLALGFIPPSIPKILGIPFTSLPESTNIGYFFNALLKTGFYYEFIGWSQLAAALLLLIPRTAHLGALLFLPIIVNITVLTISLGFAGTWVITILMSLANLFLVLWEYDRLKQVVLGTRIERPRRFRFEFLWFPAIFALGGVLSGLLAWSIGLGNFANYPAVTGFLAALGAIFGLVVTAHYRFMPVGSMKGDDPTG